VFGDLQIRVLIRDPRENGAGPFHRRRFRSAADPKPSIRSHNR
jgi:hypothetical protein